MNPTPQEMDLPPIEKPLSFVPLPGREEPAIWVAKIGVFKDWKPCDENKLRVFELHRGLNILWANPEGANSADNRLSGHGAGKSTFCRLVRHLLNEDSAGTAGFLEGLRRKFDNPWLLGEVFVNGEQWLVGRPLSGIHGHHSFAFKGESLKFAFPDKPPRQGFSDYKAALEKAALGELREKNLPDSKRDLDWQRLLPWLSRDQEAHYTGLLEWRHKDSEHQSPVPSHDDRGHILRLVLGLLNPEEKKQFELYAREAEQHERKTRERPKKESIVENDRERLSSVLGGAKIADPDEPQADMLAKTLEEKVKVLRESVNLEPAKKRQQEELAPVLVRLDDARSSWTAVDEWATELEDTIAVKEAELKGESPPPPKIDPRRRDSSNKMMTGLGPFRGYCSHYMTDAWKAECPIAHQRPPDNDEVEKAVEQIVSTPKSPKEAAIAQDKLELARRNKIVAERKRLLDAIQAEVDALRINHGIELNQINYPNQQAGQIETYLKSFKISFGDLKQWDGEIEDHKKAKDQITAALETLSKQHTSAVRAFERLYDYFAKELLGKIVTGKVEFKGGKTIHPNIILDGKRESAALKVSKWLAFDFAAMVFGFTNRACSHPRFLIHDSPRESDLARGIYAAIFTTLQQLAHQAGGSAPFQYIITTTEAPPDHLNKQPWRIDPVLDSSTDAGRLLGVNLEEQDTTQ